MSTHCDAIRSTQGFSRWHVSFVAKLIWRNAIRGLGGGKPTLSMNTLMWTWHVERALKLAEKRHTLAVRIRSQNLIATVPLQYWLGLCSLPRTCCRSGASIVPLTHFTLTTARVSYLRELVATARSMTPETCLSCEFAPGHHSRSQSSTPSLATPSIVSRIFFSVRESTRGGTFRLLEFACAEVI